MKNSIRLPAFVLSLTVAGAASAQFAKLADAPFPENENAPRVLITIDDSTSMTQYYMPQSLINLVNEQVYQGEHEEKKLPPPNPGREYTDFYHWSPYKIKFMKQILDSDHNRIAYDPNNIYLEPYLTYQNPARDACGGLCRRWDWMDEKTLNVSGRPLYGLPHNGQLSDDVAFYQGGFHSQYDFQKNIGAVNEFMRNPKIVEYSQRSLGGELYNYANWYQFYRQRLSAAKALAGLVLKDVCPGNSCENPPVIGIAGVDNLSGMNWNSNPGNWKGKPFSGSNREELIRQIYTWSGYGTSLLSDTVRNGAKVMSGGAGSCSSNAHILFTDGNDFGWQAGKVTAAATATPGVTFFPVIYGGAKKDGSITDPIIQDFQQAAKATGGRLIASSSPLKIKQMLLKVFGITDNPTGTLSGAAFSGVNLLDNDEQFAFIPSFGKLWSGDIKKYKVTRDGKVQDLKISAGENLKKQDAAKRKIFTRNNVNFSFDAMKGGGLSQEANTFGNNAQAAIDFLRGDSSNEDNMRERLSPLGDIVNAQPVAIRKPYCYEDPKTGRIEGCTLKDKSYRDFYKTNKDRETMIYAPANDGMVHAFDTDLKERWAYVPSEIMRPADKRGLVNATYSPYDEKHPFKHYYYVDATPHTFDVQFSNGSWHTMLVGGLGKGGTMYYALDVTRGDVVSSDKLKWEFTHPNMGYSYGRPILTRTRGWTNADGREQWVAILPSGYNNGSGNDSAKGSGNGKACIYFVDIEKGTLLKEMCTQEGSPTNPLNMVSIASFVVSEDTQLSTAVYGGDGKGNVWRFNLESDSPAQWTVSKLAVLNTGQYVTTEPYPFLHKKKRYVVVGTGGFRHKEDLKRTANNTLYVLRDGDAKEADKTPGEIKRAALTSRSYDSTESAGQAKLSEIGWYMDLPQGYHINLNPQGMGTDVFFAANKYIERKTKTPDANGNCDQSVYEGILFVRAVNNGDSSLLSSNGTSLKNYYAEPNGIVGFTVISVPDPNLPTGGGNNQQAGDKPKGKIMVTTGKGELNDAGGSLIDFSKTATAGVPQRTNVRYVAPE